MAAATWSGSNSLSLRLCDQNRNRISPSSSGRRALPKEHPGTAYLVIEVAFSSQRIDLVHKAPIYAAAGVPEYWVIDLVRRVVAVHREPGPPAVGDGSVGEGATYRALETVSFDSPLSVLGVTIRLADLLNV
jgi:Uma2 family endonuclease